MNYKLSLVFMSHKLEWEHNNLQEYIGLGCKLNSDLK